MSFTVDVALSLHSDTMMHRGWFRSWTQSGQVDVSSRQEVVIHRSGTCAKPGAPCNKEGSDRCPPVRQSVPAMANMLVCVVSGCPRALTYQGFALRWGGERDVFMQHDIGAVEWSCECTLCTVALIVDTAINAILTRWVDW